MSCAACAARIEKVVGRLPGVEGSVNFAAETARVRYTPVLADPAAIVAAIGKAGAINAALLSASILGAKHPQFHAVLKTFRAEQTDSVLENPDPRIA